MLLHTGGIAGNFVEAYRLPEQINPSVIFQMTAPFTQGSLWDMLSYLYFPG